MKKIKLNLKEIGFPAMYYLAMIVLSLGLLLIVSSFALESYVNAPVLLATLSIIGLTFFGVGLIFVILNRKKLIQFYVKLSYHQEIRHALSLHIQKETFDSIKHKMLDKDFVYIKHQFLYHKVFTLSKVYMQYFIQLKETKDAESAIIEFIKHLDTIQDFAQGVIKNPNKVMVLILYMEKASKADLSAIKMRIETSVALQNDYSHPSITFVPLLYDQSLQGFIFRNNTFMKRKNNFKMAMKHMKRLFFDDNKVATLLFPNEEKHELLDD